MSNGQEPASATEAENHEVGFWKQPRGFDRDPRRIFEQLREGESVEGLEPLPIAEMVEDIAKAFEHWNRIDEYDWESDDGPAFQLFTTPQFLCADCYSMQGDDMNKIIEIAMKFDCPLYDAKLDQRL